VNSIKFGKVLPIRIAGQVSIENESGLLSDYHNLRRMALISIALVQSVKKCRQYSRRRVVVELPRYNIEANRGEKSDRACEEI
jgi:hypothetical protein